MEWRWPIPSWLDEFGWAVGVLCWMIIISWVVAARQDRRAREVPESDDDRSIDNGKVLCPVHDEPRLFCRACARATALGRYVEDRWVCFEHETPWCPTCSEQARRGRGRPETPVVEPGPRTPLTGVRSKVLERVRPEYRPSRPRTPR
jgi:hypothetical protein